MRDIMQVEEFTESLAFIGYIASLSNFFCWAYAIFDFFFIILELFQTYFQTY